MILSWIKTNVLIQEEKHKQNHSFCKHWKNNQMQRDGLGFLCSVTKEEKKKRGQKNLWKKAFFFRLKNNMRKRGKNDAMTGFVRLCSFDFLVLILTTSYVSRLASAFYISELTQTKNHREGNWWSVTVLFILFILTNWKVR